MSRETSSVAFEAQYWLAVSQDLSDVNDLIVEAAGPVVDASIQVVTLAIALIGSPAGAGQIEALSTTLRETIERLRGIQVKINGIGELIDGRMVALRDEGDLPAPEPS